MTNENEGNKHFKHAHDHAHDIVQVLHNDYSRALDEYETSASDQYRRRNLVRCFSAYVEGAVSSFKDFMLYCHENDFEEFSLSEAELAILREHSYQLDEQGCAKVSARFLPVVANIRFTYELLIQRMDIEQDLDVTAPEWAKFIDVIKMRHRLMHPRNIYNVTVSDEEIGSALGACQWFIETTNKVMVGLVKSCIIKISQTRVQQMDMLVELGYPPDEARARVMKKADEIAKRFPLPNSQSSD